MKATTQLAAVVNEINITDTGIYASASCGKTSATVVINDWEIRVICHNAAHKVWRGAGRAFATVTEALSAYKTPEMKAIILAVNERNS